MLHLLIITPEREKLKDLSVNLERSGFVCSTIACNNGVREAVIKQHPDILLLDMEGHSSHSEIRALVQRMKQERQLLVMALVPGQVIGSIDGHLDVADDFVISPYDAREVALRAGRLLHRTGDIDSRELIKCDGLVIDIAKCEVTIEGKIVELTFKEYELLKQLASNRGRVYTRDVLLERIWGYDYYGGDRTVDVHIRRLRSKIEDSKHNFIETVRNIGYRFRKDF